MVDRDDRIKDEKIMMTMIIIKLMMMMMIQARREKQCDDGKTAAMGALECSDKEVGPELSLSLSAKDFYIYCHHHHHCLMIG